MTEVSQNLPSILARTASKPTRHTRAQGIPLAPQPCQGNTGRFEHQPDAQNVPSTRNAAHFIAAVYNQNIAR